MRFETTEQSANQMAASTLTQLSGASDTTVLAGEAEAGLWRQHGLVESGADGLLASIAVLPARTCSALDDVELLAARFGLTIGTVKGYVSAVFVKLKVADRTQAALYALRHGLIPPDPDQS